MAIHSAIRHDDDTPREIGFLAAADGASGIGIALNAVPLAHVHRAPFAELSFAHDGHPITAYTQTHFLTANAVARHKAVPGSGVILTLSTPAGSSSFPLNEASGTVGVLALVLPWLLGGLHPGREDFTWAILVSLLVGLFGKSTVLLSVFDIIRLEGAAGVGSK
jgi:hypothetical protein